MKISASSAWETSYFSVCSLKNSRCHGAVKNSMDMEWVSHPSMVGDRRSKIGIVRAAT